MLFKLLLLFTLVPLAEFYLLWKISEASSLGFTFAVVLATGVVGATLARWQGLSWRQRLHDDLTSGQLPTDSLLDGLMIFIAGALLITPGVLTDVVGFSLLLPPIRSVYRRWIKKRFVRGFQTRPGDRPGRPSEPFGAAGGADSRRDVIIDSYVIEHDAEKDSGE